MRLKPVDDSPLPWRPRGSQSERFRQFCKRFLRVPKGHGVGKPVILRDWQLQLVASVMDAEPRPRLAGWMIGRGNGKSSLLAMWAVFELFTYGQGASVVVCARSQDQARIIFNTARQFVEQSPELKARVQVARDRMYIPATFSSFDCLVSEPQALEGLDFSLCLVDEIGVTPKETVDVLMLAQGKRPTSTLVGIGTPPADPEGGVLHSWRLLHEELGDDFIVWREFSADAFQHHDLLCEHCIRLANPAYGDFLAMDAFVAAAKTASSEAAYRRARLCQLIASNEHPFIDSETWADLASPGTIADGAEVVIALDGSQKDDSTALVIGTVESTPHFDKLGVWEKPAGDDSWRVPVLDVEQAIRDAAVKYEVREIAFDPWLWTRSAQILEAEGLPMVEFRQSPARQTAATNDLHSSAVNARFTHSGDPDLTRHVLAATVKESDKGIRIAKTSRSRHAPKIDLATALMMCHSRTTWLAAQHKPHYRYGGM
ncbi:terminase large subunit domain-containing protein [Mycobacterium sp. PDNC021]|uniref:terminase large subunit domain-containing protein n=1 Tax=Mycobacterium sp. PDNC021 TaxID=3391399 RepID=UPI003AAFF7FE